MPVYKLSAISLSKYFLKYLSKNKKIISAVDDFEESIIFICPKFVLLK